MNRSATSELDRLCGRLAHVHSTNVYTTAVRASLPRTRSELFFRVSEESKRQKPPRVLTSRPPAGVIENWIETQVADHDD